MTKSLIPAALGLLVGISCEPYGAIPPAPSRWVTDRVGLLSPAILGSLDRRLEAYQAKTGHPIAVWISDTTRGMPHSEWCPLAHNAWGVGRKGHDDGVILFVFTEDNYRWISTGWGMEGALPDKECSRIIRELIRPAMENGDPDAGVTAGVAAIISAIEAQERREANAAGTGASAPSASP